MENAMESYHLFRVHRETLEPTTPTKHAYYIADSPEWTLTGGEIAQSSSKLTRWLYSGTSKNTVYDQYVLISLPPSFVGILTYESFDWLAEFPVEENRVLIHSAGMTTGKQYTPDKKTKEFTRKFYDEDKWICERVHRGMKSRKGLGGKLVEMERVITDFHQYLANRLFDSSVGAFHQDPKAEMFLNHTQHR